VTAAAVRPRIREHVIAGGITALLAVVGEAVVLVASGLPPAGALATALGSLAGLYLPLGLAAGFALGVLASILPGLPGLGPWVRLAARPRSLFRPDARAFANAVSALAGVGAFLALLFVSFHHFATRYHDPVLAGLAHLGAAIPIGFAALVVARIVERASRGVGLVLGPLASPGTVLAAMTVVFGIAIAVFAIERPEFFRVYRPLAFAWIPALLAIDALLLALLRRAFFRGPRARIAATAGVAAVAVATLGLFAWTAASYGGSSRVRSLVEDHSVAGLTLVRSYARASDRDGDGYSFAFGGEDCDDSRSSIFPGAPDPAGDGVDADCFDGDGTRRRVDAVGDGAYGRVPSTLGKPNVLLFMVDALRPDHLGLHGYERPTSPNLDRFARGATVFETAIAHSSRSIRSIPALFTGFEPTRIAFGDEYLWVSLKPENQTLAEELSAHGYHTIGIIGTDYFDRSNGFFQGFEELTRTDEMWPLDHRWPVDQAIARLATLATSEEPWFMWVHQFNVHLPYMAQTDQDSRFGTTPIDRYDTAISRADDDFGRLMEALSTHGLDDETVVIVASDHGEAFGEHGNEGHSFTLYEEEVRATLMIRAPSFTARRVPDLVGLSDVTPTVLNLVSRPVPKPMPGRSLVPLMSGGRFEPDRFVVSELMPDGQFPFDRKTIRVGSMRLHWWTREGRVELYDLAIDPHEQDDLSDDRVDDRRELLGLLRAWTSATSLPENQHRFVVWQNILARPPATMTRRLDLDVQGDFRVLGYDLPSGPVRRGEALPITFYYEVERATDSNFFFLVEAELPPGHPPVGHMHAEHYPLNGRYPTTMWNAGEILRDHSEITLPLELRPAATLELTLAIRGDDRRLVRFSDGRTTVSLGRVTVE
jgi:choline-sulfatase